MVIPRQPRSLGWYNVSLITNPLILTDVMDRTLHVAKYVREARQITATGMSYL